MLQPVKNSFVQGDRQWHLERMGCITGSRFARALGSIDTRIRLIKELIYEREALKSGAAIEFDEPDIGNFNHGHKWEPRALAEYQLRYFIDDENIQTPAIVKHKKIKWIKYSPDALECMSEDFNGYCKLLEIKSPVEKFIHLATLHSGMPPEHKPQVQGGLWVTGFDTAIFISYHNNFPTDQQLYIQAIDRDQAYINTLECACLDILEHVKNNTVPKASIHSIPKLF